MNGWERPNYYAPQGFDDHAARSFRRGGWWPYAVEEARAIRENVGMIDASRLRQARGEGAGRHRLPRLVHHQPAAEGRAAQPDLRPDRRGHRSAPSTPSAAGPRTTTTSSPPAPGPPTTPTICARAADKAAAFGTIVISALTSTSPGLRLVRGLVALRLALVLRERQAGKWPSKSEEAESQSAAHPAPPIRFAITLHSPGLFTGHRGTMGRPCARSGDLHIHVGGAVAPHILWSIAHQQGFKLPVKNYFDFVELDHRPARQQRPTSTTT